VIATRVFGGAAGALRVAAFRNYFAGQFVSSMGRWMYRMSIGWLAWDMTSSTTWLGAVAFADLAPTAVLTIFAGAIADRLGYMRVIRLNLVLVCVLSGLLGALVISGSITIELLMLVALLSGSAEAMGQPARLAIVNALVPKYHLSAAIALGSASFNASRIVGPSIAGPMILWTGPGSVMLLCSLANLYFLVTSLNLSIEKGGKKKRKDDSLLLDTLAAMNYVRNHGSIRFVMILLTATSLLVRPVIELLPSIADKVFHAGPTGLSLMLSAIGVGAVSTSLVLARRGHTKGLTRLLVWSTFGTGICVAFALQAPSINVAAISFCLMGVCMLSGNVSAQTLVQNSVSTEMRARVLGLFIVFGHGLPAVGALAQGWLASYFGLPAAVSGSAILMLGFWVWALFVYSRVSGELERARSD
jgi:MFS family permease